MLTVMMISYLLIIQTDNPSDLVILDVPNVYQADILRKRMQYNPKAMVERRLYFVVLEVSHDSTGVDGLKFIPIPNTKYKAKSRMLLKPLPKLGGYVAQIRKRYEKE